MINSFPVYGAMILFIILCLSLLKLDCTAFTIYKHCTATPKCVRNMLCMRTVYRNAQEDDMLLIAQLCSDTFEGPFEWHQALQRQSSINNFKQQFEDRFSRFIRGGKKHAMICAVEADTTIEAGVEGCSNSYINSGDAVAGKICSYPQGLQGFLEIGTLPSPVPVEVGWLGNIVKAKVDVPFIGNVAVAPQHRRRGVGTRLVRIAERVAQKWGDSWTFVAVDVENMRAVALYTRLGYQVCLDERDLISRDTRRQPRLFMRKNIAASTASVASVASAAAAATAEGISTNTDSSVASPLSEEAVVAPNARNAIEDDENFYF